MIIKNKEVWIRWRKRDIFWWIFFPYQLIRAWVLNLRFMQAIFKTFQTVRYRGKS